MSTSSPPPVPTPQVPDYGTVANAQWKYTLPAAEAQQTMNAVNQYNPYGSMTYAQTGTGPNGVPIYSATTTLSPEQQLLFNQLMSTKETAGTQGGDLLAGAQYGVGSPSEIIGDATRGNTSALMAMQTQYLQPFMEWQRNQADTALRNQGIFPSPSATADPSTWGAYERRMHEIDTQQGNTMAQAAAQFEPQAFNQASSLYTMPAWLSQTLAQFGAPGDVKSQLNPTPTVNIAPPNVVGAAANQGQIQSQNAWNQYNALMDQYSANQQGMWGIPTAILGGWAQSGGMQQLGSAAASALPALMMMSDARLKRDIVPLSLMDNGIGIYHYRYLDDNTPHVGVIAQEVLNVRPDAVHVRNDGYLMVNYANLLLNKGNK